jgi:hypothetical protein
VDFVHGSNCEKIGWTANDWALVTGGTARRFDPPRETRVVEMAAQFHVSKKFIA